MHGAALPRRPRGPAAPAAAHTPPRAPAPPPPAAGGSGACQSACSAMSVTTSLDTLHPRPHLQGLDAGAQVLVPRGQCGVACGGIAVHVHGLLLPQPRHRRRRCCPETLCCLLGCHALSSCSLFAKHCVLLTDLEQCLGVGLGQHAQPIHLHTLVVGRAGRRRGRVQQSHIGAQHRDAAGCQLGRLAGQFALVAQLVVDRRGKGGRHIDAGARGNRPVPCQGHGQVRCQARSRHRNGRQIELLARDELCQPGWWCCYQGRAQHGGAWGQPGMGSPVGSGAWCTGVKFNDNGRVGREESVGLVEKERAGREVRCGWHQGQRLAGALVATWQKMSQGCCRDR
eukprot:m.193137 g.193137  ORF g.193137 m.193137 type:complete len:340 (-) comp15439_c0_seq9:1266-2285(-)